MKLTISKIAVLILLPAFFITSVGSMPGYAWCFGVDGHKKVENVGVSGCDDENLENSNAVRNDKVSVARFVEDHCGPCLDFYLQLNDATSTKRPENKSPASFDAITINNSLSSSSQIVRMVVGNLVPQPPPRISQTILNQRTVVLLN